MRKIMAVALLAFALGLVSASMALADPAEAGCSKIQKIKFESPQGKEIEKALLAFIKRKHGLTARVHKFRTMEKLGRWILS